MNAHIPGDRAAATAIDEIDLLRATEYRLIGALLARAPDAATLRRVAQLGGGPGVLGTAHAGLARAAALADPAAVAREHFALFVGVGRSELLPFASYYMTGFLHERPLAAVRADLATLGLEREDGLHEPEDHLAILAETMALLAEGRVAGASDGGRGFFERHLAPWAGRFFADLAKAPSARFYRAAGALGEAFMDVEAQAFDMETGASRTH